jgi:hypothetical protein
MAEQGFEYKPMDTTGGISYGGGEGLGQARDVVLVRVHGLGLLDRGRVAARPIHHAVAVLRLSESEQAAYYEALYGPSPTEEELNDDGSYEWNWETADARRPLRVQVGEVGVVRHLGVEVVDGVGEVLVLAYYEALYGPSPTEEELNDDGSYEWNWETAGCSGWAQHELNGEDPWSSGEHQDLTGLGPYSAS